jgi:hypothetical protein
MLTVELQDTVHEHGGTSHQTWIAIEEQFLVNREARTLHLNHVCQAFIEADLNVKDYCRKMKGMVDALRNLNEPVPDRTLVLNILWGMNMRYNHLKTFLNRVVSFLYFHDICNDLLVEITMGAALL